MTKEIEHQGRHVTMVQAYNNFLKQMGNSTSIELNDRCDKNCMNKWCLKARMDLIHHKNN